MFALFLCIPIPKGVRGGIKHKTIMKNKLLLFLMVFATLMPLNAQIKLQLLNRQELREVASSLGKMVFAEDKMLVYDLQNNLLIELPIDEDLSIKVNADESHVTIYSGDEQELDIDIPDGLEQIMIKGISAGSIIRVYTINGTLISQFIAMDTTTSLSTENIPSGTYIMQINNTILKILKP